MKFDKYLEILQKIYLVEKQEGGVYKVSHNGREIYTSEEQTYDLNFLKDYFSSSKPMDSDFANNIFAREVLGEDALSLRNNKFHLDSRESGNFGRIGEDDLLPNIGHKDLLTGGRRPVRGSIPDPSSSIFGTRTEEKEDESTDDNPFIKKDPITPFKGKKDPDPDHFRKPGGDDTDFYY